MAAPTQEEQDDFLLSARYGEVDEVKAFGEKHGWDAVSSIQDERGNTALHMACGNGHLDVVKLLLPHAPAAYLQKVNEAGSPAIHWAVMNNHVEIVIELANIPEEKGGGLSLVKQKNAAGRDALAEATFAGEGKEQVAGWLEGFVWKAEGGKDEPEKEIEAKESDSNEDVAAEQDGEGTVSVAEDEELAKKAGELDVSNDKA